MRKALYAGSFDPITLGHLDVLRQACDVFDVVHVAVGQNPKKAGLFTPTERMALVLSSMPGSINSSKVEVGSFEGSAAKYARSIGATHLIRGLRQVSDFNDEFVYNGAMQQIAPDLPMAYFICRSEYLHVSSSTARELASLSEHVDWLVTPNVSRALKEKFA
jgi:pantetheine-phosphate adenylyltransferase